MIFDINFGDFKFREFNRLDALAAHHTNNTHFSLMKYNLINYAMISCLLGNDCELVPLNPIPYDDSSDAYPLSSSWKDIVGFDPFHSLPQCQMRSTS